MYDNENNNGIYNNSETDSTNNNNNSESNNTNSYYNSSENDNSNNYYNSSQNNTNSYYDNSDNDNQNPDNKKNNKNKAPMVAIVVIIAAVILVAALVVTVATTYKNINSSDLDQIVSDGTKQTESSYEDIGSTSIENNQSTSSSSSGVTVTDVSGVVDGTIPSIVAITSTTVMESSSGYYDQFWDYYFGGGGNSGNGKGDQTYEEVAAGSGIIVDQTDTELLIVTNNHVVEGADSLAIQFYGQSDEESVTGYIKGTDSNADVAVVAVKLKDIPKDVLSNIKKATLGDSDNVKVGEGVIAIGNALGYGQSVTTGIISAKDRKATIEDTTMTLLQTDAAINGGNSGGALINASGEVIGINVAKYSSSGDSTSASVEGMGFAIPISSVKDIISNLETKETREKIDEDEQGYLGITGFDVSSDDSTQYGIPEGVYVYSVSEDGPAAKAGIEESDVITKFDGQTVATMDSLQSIMAYYKSGEKVKVTIAYRDGREYKEKEVTVTLGDKSVTDELQTQK